MTRVTHLSIISESPAKATKVLIVVALMLGLAVPAPSAGGTLLPVHAIQGDGLVSPYIRSRVDTYGVVTAVAPEGFYLQDPAGDGRSETSDGIYVYTRGRPDVAPADCIEVYGAYVDEFYGKTELSRIKEIRMADGCTGRIPPAVPLPAAGYGIDPTARYEQFEGMRIALGELAGSVQGPTKRFANGDVELSLAPEMLAPYLEDSRVHQAASAEMDLLVYLSGALGAVLPSANWGDTVTVPGGEAILDYNFGKYQLLLLPGVQVQHAPQVRLGEAAQPAAEDEFTVCSFNLYGMGRGTAQYVEPAEYATQLDRRARVIAEVLGGCTIVALQEAGTPADAEALAVQLRTAYGLDYAATALPGPQSSDDEFPLTNAVLARTGRVRIAATAGGQGCSPVDYGVVDGAAACEDGAYPLFDRPPLVVDVVVEGTWGAPLPLRIIANHWKSKGGDESVNAPRRLAQAAHVATLLQPALDADPTAAALALGDLNDYYGSEPVQVLQTATQPALTHIGGWLPEADRYTYIFNGGSQMLDHVLATEGLAGNIAEVNVLHVDADFATPAVPDPAYLRHVSDHDPVLVRIRPGAAAWLGGNLGHVDIDVTVRDMAGKVAGSGQTDRRGDFRIWNLPRARVRIEFTAPDYLVLPTPAITATLLAGPNHLRLPPAEHEAVAAGRAAVVATVSNAAQTR